MSIKKIIKAILHPTAIKIVAMFCIVGLFFILPTYAQQDVTANASLLKIQELLKIFLSLISRLRIVLAILAGKLMTNDFVYGAFIHMDVYLWKIRNIMKNFANFALAGLVLVSIVKGIVGKETLDVKKIITNTLVAGILIQASWFLVGAVVDISTVATAAISAFPMSFLKSDTNLQEQIGTGITNFKAKRVIVDLNATGRSNALTTVDEQNSASLLANSAGDREKILPNQSSVAGPFIYLGMGVFHFPEYLTTDSTTGLVNLTFDFATRFFLIFFFTVGLLLLLIANILRIGILRIFIIGSPFLILMQVFNKKAGDSGLAKIFSMTNFISAVFKPVIFVAGVSIMLIIVVSMQNGMKTANVSRENNLNGVSLGMTGGGSTSTLNVEGLTNISLKQTDLLGKNVIKSGQNIFSEFIVFLLTLFIMRGFIKLSLTIGGGYIEEKMKGLIKQAETIAKSAPILPVKGGASVNSLGSFRKNQIEGVAKGFGMSTDGRFTDAEEGFQQKINDWMDIKGGRVQQNYRDLTNTIETGGDFMGKSITIGQTTSDGLSLSNPTRKGLLDSYFKNAKSQKAIKDKGFVGDYKDFESFFGTKDSKDSLKNREILAKWMSNGTQPSSGKGTDTYEDFLNTVYHKSSKK